jgi:hypothetical protein
VNAIAFSSRACQTQRWQSSSREASNERVFAKMSVQKDVIHTVVASRRNRIHKQENRKCAEMAGKREFVSKHEVF